MPPKVSICIPTYNGEKFLAAALNSAIEQTYANLEIIISDDNSQDRTVEIVRDRQARSSLPIELLQHDRYGLVENWNFCVDRSDAKYIKFLFQDDLLEPDCVTQMVEVAEQDARIGMVFSRRRLISDRPDLMQSIEWMADLHKSWTSIRSVQAGLELIADPNFLQQPDNKIGEPTNVLIRRNIFESIGLFDPAFKQYCDLEMWWRIMAHSQIAFIDRELATFRLHRHQTTNHNLSQDTIWAEIYQVWIKLICDPVYQTIPDPICQRIRKHSIGNLLQEFPRSIYHRKWHRLHQIYDLLRQVISLG